MKSILVLRPILHQNHDLVRFGIRYAAFFLRFGSPLAHNFFHLVPFDDL